MRATSDRAEPGPARKRAASAGPPEEYWLHEGGDVAPVEVLIRSERLATVRVKPLGDGGRELATVVKIENGLQAVSP
ncbi:hypothetical protein [Actinoallomurus acaciae]|uniref:Uncharacterized protein n=1 Tax=Actinoallomurus acaciae TaxID=502577 RepID=A0ABV5YMU4_9ACTN